MGTAHFINLTECNRLNQPQRAIKIRSDSIVRVFEKVDHWSDGDVHLNVVVQEGSNNEIFVMESPEEVLRLIEQARDENILP